jgi:hypothetical protein
MSPHSDALSLDLAFAVHFATLPGPSRKRKHAPYCYRLVYRNPQPGIEGCALLWEVHGGRLAYQVALERERAGGLRWHCTCADHVYRHEDFPDYRCKHVRGLLALGRPAPALAPEALPQQAS